MLFYTEKKVKPLNTANDKETTQQINVFILKWQKMNNKNKSEKSIYIDLNICR